MLLFLYFQINRIRSGAVDSKSITTDLLRRLSPYHKAMQARPVFTMLRYALHIGIIVVPLWYSGHIYLWEGSQLQWSWTALPDKIIDWITILVIVLLALFFIQKVIRYHCDSKPKPSEWVLLVLTALPFLSGFFYTRHLLPAGGFLGQNMELIHVLSGEVMILVVVFLSLTIRIDSDKCTGCASCKINCLAGAIESSEDSTTRTFNYQPASCIVCAACIAACPEGAVELKHHLSLSSIFRNGKKAPIMAVELKKCDFCGAPFATLPLIRNAATLIDSDQVVFCNDCKQQSALHMLNR